jgi:CMP-N,N'-diacetyllegionaminic acid synthase
MPKSLAIIPARSGSKRLPRKNILDLCGKPLIQYTIDTAVECADIIDHVFSTDSEEIRTLATSLGAFAPFLRPAELSTDGITNFHVMEHAASYLKTNYNLSYDSYILLQPTSPFRTAEDIRNSIRLFNNHASVPTLASVTGPYKKRHPILKQTSNSDAVTIANIPINSSASVYMYNASIYIVDAQFFHRHRRIHSTPELFYVMNEYAIDIDTYDDLLAAKCLHPFFFDHSNNRFIS